MSGEVPPAAELPAELPTELWMEILSKLPARVLARFRCVSKTWCSIIDDPKFICMHLHVFKANSEKCFFLFWENYLESIFVSNLRIRRRITDDAFGNCVDIFNTRYIRPQLKFKHLGNADGLMLFSRYRLASSTSSDDECDGPSFDQVFNKMYLDLYLFNPSIMKFVTLPPLPPHPGHREMIFLGFDPVGKDHKVVACLIPFWVSQGTAPGFIMVYELSTRCWRANNTSSIQVQDNSSLKKGVYAKGAMHWIYHDSSLVPESRNYTHLASFKFSNEEFTYSRLPGDRDDGGETLTFPFSLDDSFAIFNLTSTSTCIWVLTRCGDNGRETWSKWYTGASDLDTYGFFQQHKDDIDHVLYVEKIHKLLLAVNTEVIFYDMETHTMEDFISQCYCVMEPYVQSLFLCKGTGSKLLDPVS